MALRWVPKGLGLDLKLQQGFEIAHYEDSTLVRVETEWRDVPIEMNPNAR